MKPHQALWLLWDELGTRWRARYEPFSYEGKAIHEVGLYCEDNGADCFWVGNFRIPNAPADEAHLRCYAIDALRTVLDRMERQDHRLGDWREGLPPTEDP